MRVRVLTALCVVLVAGWSIATPAGSLPAGAPPTTTITNPAITTTTTTTTTITTPATTTPAPATAPPVTFNEFLPEERGLGDCISAIPRPGCGSEARGGWRQTLVFLTLVAGLTLIVWRVVAGARRARREQMSTN